MTTLPRPTGLAAAFARSVFRGEDVCAAAGLPVCGAGPRPCFDDAVWDFTGVIGLPRYLARYARILSFTEIVNPQWRELAKEFIFARLAPDHHAVRELAHAYRTPVQIATVHGRLTVLTGWLNWLTEQGVDRLGEVTQQHCAAYLELRKRVRDKHGVRHQDPRDPGRGRPHRLLSQEEPRRLTAARSVPAPGRGVRAPPGRAARGRRHDRPTSRPGRTPQESGSRVEGPARRAAGATRRAR